jgi:hypothetical protein
VPGPGRRRRKTRRRSEAGSLESRDRRPGGETGKRRRRAGYCNRGRLAATWALGPRPGGRGGWVGAALTGGVRSRCFGSDEEGWRGSGVGWVGLDWVNTGDISRSVPLLSGGLHSEQKLVPPTTSELFCFCFFRLKFWFCSDNGSTKGMQFLNFTLY